jgi:HD-GYP domain-containing protein (c-di-GMP phosphodiesterase class II)
MPNLITGRYPLHITISTLFITLIFLFGTVLGIYNYTKTSDILLSTTRQIFDHLGKELGLNNRLSQRPVSQAVTMLANSGIEDAESLEERLAFLPQFCAGLRGVEEMTALQVGYSSGDYFIVRILSSDYMRKQFTAPDGTEFVVDNIVRSRYGTASLTRIWYSDSLKEVKRALPKPSRYDPRTRPWYQASLETDRVMVVEPYLFWFVGQVGVTLSYRKPHADIVVAGDITLENFSKRLSAFKVTNHSEVVLLHKSGKVIAYKDTSKLVVQQDSSSFRLAKISDLNNPLLEYVRNQFGLQTRIVNFTFAGEEWLGGVRKVDPSDSDDYYLLMVSPKKELLAQAMNIQQRAVGISIFMVLLTIPLIWFAARLIATPLRTLAGEVEQINRFNFSEPIRNRSLITEVDELAIAMGMMKDTIDKFLTLMKSLANEQDFDEMLRLITEETMLVSRGDGATIYLVDDSDGRLSPAVCLQRDGTEADVSRLPFFSPEEGGCFFNRLRDGKMSYFTEDSQESDIFSQFRAGLDGILGSVVVFPLQNRNREGIGLLCLFYNDVEDFRGKEQQARRAFLQTFAGLAAVSMEGKKQLKMQKRLLESFVTLLAGAIDSKSPYTGGHCQRVPVLTKLLAKKACEAKEGPYRDFTLDDEQWEALHIASWLHDCGKVTTPEYVVDKSTKLETIYDRIHEIRMRFEVLYRDAQIRYWQELVDNGDESGLREQLEARLAQLRDDFAFVAECNLGGEFMAPERAQKLDTIAKTTWQRYFNDSIGISWEEQQRKSRTAALQLPVTEYLLADKDEHLIEHTSKPEYDPEDGFILTELDYLYNRGELYNLKVARGTLTDEERYRINDHIVQTIKMLKELPYPKHLQTVPEIAGGHHEKMDGTGYPRGLSGEEMSPQAKMMVIADIFEALTASDRPYKKPKKLSEAIQIMGFMVDNNHIDPDLFRLFLSSGTYREYAEQYLDPDQVDEVDIDGYCD